LPLLLAFLRLLRVPFCTHDVITIEMIGLSASLYEFSLGITKKFGFIRPYKLNG